MRNGESVGEFGGGDKIEGPIAEEVVELEEEAVHKNGQERECEGGDPQPAGEENHRPDSQNRRSPWQEASPLIPRTFN